MKHVSRHARRLILSLTLAATCALPASFASQRPDGIPENVINDTYEQADARAIFPDAPLGVDPVVTGPVSDAFRDRQKTAGCEQAVWPNIPRLCYPG